jgi:hypothetical protein
MTLPKTLKASWILGLQERVNRLAALLHVHIISHLVQQHAPEMDH